MPPGTVGSTVNVGERGNQDLNKELYFTVEGPRGKAEIFEIVPDGADGTGPERSWEPVYELQFGGRTEPYASEGEAITVAQQLVGAQSVY